MLRMTHLSKAYRTEVVETYALRDFAIHVREGEFVAVTDVYKRQLSPSVSASFARVADAHTYSLSAASADTVRGRQRWRRQKLPHEEQSLGSPVSWHAPCSVVLRYIFPGDLVCTRYAVCSS